MRRADIGVGHFISRHAQEGEVTRRRSELGPHVYGLLWALFAACGREPRTVAANETSPGTSSTAEARNERPSPSGPDAEASAKPSADDDAVHEGGDDGEASGEPRDDEQAVAQHFALLASRSDASCKAMLSARGFRLKPLPDDSAPDAKGCGVPRKILVTRGPSGIAYIPPVQVDCGFAPALDSLERIASETAKSSGGMRVTRIRNFGAYACREKPTPGEHRSEHTFGHAIDVSGFDLLQPTSGSPKKPKRPNEVKLSVATDFGRTTGNLQGPLFLQQVLRRLRRAPGVTHVLGPPDRKDHADHFHLDDGPGWGQ